MTRTAGTIGRAAVAAASAAIVGLFALVLTSGSAAATNPPIAISGDGITYAASYPGQLFQGVLLVPTGSATRSFWVKNTGPSGANLAVTLIDVSSLDPEYLAAITITATSGSHTGNARFSDAGECVSLVYGIHLAPGQSARVDAKLAMANLSGTTAQGAQAAFNLGVNLTSDDVAAPTGCSAVVEPSPTPTPSPTGTPGDGDGDGDGGTVIIPGVPTQPTDPSATPSPTASPEPTATPTPTPSPSPDPGDPDPDGVKGNTDRFYQEWFIAAWVIEAMLGGYFAWRAWRKREIEGAQS